MSIYDKAFALALRGGSHLLKSATATTQGVRFPEILKSRRKVYEPDLYHGAAGVGLALLDLFQATADEAYARLAREVSYDLIECSPARLPINPGLYSGYSGIAFFHLSVARILKDPFAWQEVHRLAQLLLDQPLEGSDLLHGAAGTGIFFLHLFGASRQERYLDAARRSVRFLNENARKDARGICWAPGPLPPRTTAALRAPQTGLSHGAAGICLFLIEMASVTGEDEAIALYENGVLWLNRKMVRRGNGAFWPVSMAESRFGYHWCHGSAGIGQAYLALYRRTGDSRALPTAEAAARATRCLLPAAELLYHCHGLSGIIEYFLDLEVHGAGSKWRLRAGELLPRIENAVERGHGPTGLGVEATSLELGTAGVMRALLRLAGRPVISILAPLREPIDLPLPKGPEAISIPKKDARHFRKRYISSGKAISALLAVDGKALLPRLAREVRRRKAPLITGPPNKKEVAQILAALTCRHGPRFFMNSLNQVLESSERLAREHGQILCPGILDSEFHGPFIREIAGLSLSMRQDGVDRAAIAATLTNQYLSMLKLFLTRLDTDRNGILSSEVGGRVTGLEILGSDPHRGGQRVIAATFEDGQELVYKSRGVGPERFLVGSTRSEETLSLAERINRWLKPAIPAGRLPTHRVIVAGLHHGYAERLRTESVPMDYAPPEPGLEKGTPADPLKIRATQLRRDDEARFWYSAGLLAGLAIGIGFFDLHQENLVCARSAASPLPALHPVDLEVAFTKLECLLETHLIDLTPVEQPELHARGVHIHAGLDREPKLCATSNETWILQRSCGGLEVRPGFRAIGDLDFGHLVRNHDGSFGYGVCLCKFLRGIIDLWEVLKRHEEEVEAYLRDHVSGSPLRLMFRSTGEYTLWFRKRRALAYPSPATSMMAHRPMAEPLFPEEMDQIDAYDIPYFFRYEGDKRRGFSGIRWFGAGPVDGPGKKIGRKKMSLELSPFWKIVGRQIQLPVLARTLADAVSFVAPKGIFDIRDDALGVRAFRNADDPKIWFVALLRDSRLTCRIAGQGGLEMWMD